MDGGNVWGYLFLFSLVVFGLRKMWRSFDSDDKVKKAGQNWLIGLFK